MRRLTVVIKLGTSSIVDERTHKPLIDILSLIVKTATKLREDGHHVLIVSSGAIGVALKIMDLERRPKHLPRVQALAAVGQSRLMRLWDELFSLLDQPIAQILLTRNDIADRTQYLNAQNTLQELFNMGIIPIVNENDTLSVAEIKFGDNDTLSAITAGMVQADYLFLMTDVDCLYDKNPRKFSDATPIEIVEDIATLDADVTTAGSALGTGGMGTKITAARLATAAGVMTVITKSSKPGNIGDILNYVEVLRNKGQSTTQSTSPAATALETSHKEVHSLSDSVGSLSLDGPTLPKISGTSTPMTPALYNENVQLSVPLHTRFLPDPHPIRDRNFWILNGLAAHGAVLIDKGAHRALERKAGLLPVGVVDVQGYFGQQEAVRIIAVDRIPSTAPTASTAGWPTSPRSVAGSGNGSDEESPRQRYMKGSEIEVGRAIVNYSSGEIRRIRGLRSTEIASILGYADSDYVALRENVALAKLERSRPATPSMGLGVDA